MIDSLDQLLAKTEFLDAKELDDLLNRPACDLGWDTTQAFRSAASHRRDAGIDDRMRRAMYAYRSQYLPEDECQLREADDVIVYIGIYQRLRDIWLAWHFDRVGSAGHRIYTISPTPVVETSQAQREAAIEVVLKKVMNEGIQDPLSAAKFASKEIASLKFSIINEITKAATQACRQVEMLFDDKAVEGALVRCYRDMMHDFTLYPYCVMKFPSIKIEKKIVGWKKGAPQYKDEPVMYFERIAPPDFYWSGDSTNCQNGESVFVRRRISQDTLRSLSKTTKGFVKNNVDSLLQDGLQYPKATWLDGYGVTEKEEFEKDSSFAESYIVNTIDCIERHFKVRGSVLKDYGVSKYKAKNIVNIDDDEYYQVEVWVVEGRVIYIAPNISPRNERPFYSTSFEPTPGCFVGQGMYDMIAHEEKGACFAVRQAMKNAYYSGISTEITGNRFGEQTTPSSIQPFSSHKTEIDSLSGGQSAIRIHDLHGANNLAALQGLVADFDQKAQRKIGIFDMMAGSTADMGSSMRTSGNLKTVQANGNKLIMHRERNFDGDILSPAIKNWYSYFMAYHSDDSIKVDADIDVQGLDSVTAREKAQESAINLLQYVTPALKIQAETGMDLGLTTEFMRDVVYKAMGATSADTSLLQAPEAAQEVSMLQGGLPNEVEQPAPLDMRSATPARPEQFTQLPANAS